jgi:ABC-type ATPase involved in cell division
MILPRPQQRGGEVHYNPATYQLTRLKKQQMSFIKMKIPVFQEHLVSSDKTAYAQALFLSTNRWPSKRKHGGNR